MLGHLHFIKGWYNYKQILPAALLSRIMEDDCHYKMIKW